MLLSIDSFHRIRAWWNTIKSQKMGNSRPEPEKNMIGKKICSVNINTYNTLTTPCSSNHLRGLANISGQSCKLKRRDGASIL